MRAKVALEVVRHEAVGVVDEAALLKALDELDDVAFASEALEEGHFRQSADI